MKKILGIMLTLVVFLSVFACGQRSPGPAELYAQTLDIAHVMELCRSEDVQAALVDLSGGGAPDLYFRSGAGGASPTIYRAAYENGKLEELRYVWGAVPKAYFERRTGNIRWFYEIDGRGGGSAYRYLGECVGDAPRSDWLSYANEEPWAGAAEDTVWERWKIRDELVPEEQYNEFYKLWREAFEEIPALEIEWVSLDGFSDYAAKWKPAEPPPFTPDPNAPEFPRYNED